MLYWRFVDDPENEAFPLLPDRGIYSTDFEDLENHEAYLIQVFRCDCGDRDG